MKKILVLLAEGFEEIEAAAPIDIWRRFGMPVTTAMVNAHPSLLVKGQQGLAFKADIPIDSAYAQDFDMIFLPGGKVREAYASSEKTVSLIKEFAGSSKVICAVCAAPMFLAQLGLLNGRKAAVHPSLRDDFQQAGALYSASDVVIDGQFITGRGAGTAAKLAFTVAATIDKEKAQELADTMQFN